MYDQFKYSIKVVEFENLIKMKSLFLEFTSLLDFLKIGKIASNRLSSQKSQYHQANCSSLVVNQSLRYQNQANFKVVKSANYFAHLMFAHPVDTMFENNLSEFRIAPKRKYENSSIVSYEGSFINNVTLGRTGVQKLSF